MLISCSAEPEPPSATQAEAAKTTLRESTDATYVGTPQCGSCHAEALQAWEGSHHALAMQPATADTVLGDFNNAQLEHFGEIAEFFRRDAAYYVGLTDPQGERSEYRIAETFGVEPLQQYLVDFPGGRKQALQYLWDVRPAAAGGQRWYHLYPDEYLAADDPLHWTGDYFRWNTHCAECHSTDLQVGYDPLNHQFDTRYAEISVGCEACHGPGSEHVRQANEAVFDARSGFPVDLDDRAASAWRLDTATGIAELSGTRPSPQQQPETCGRCHARRGLITADYEHGKPLTDTHVPSLLDDGLYFADGRILDEVYVYGSFVQSRMYAAGVTCSDCHEPHSATLRTGPDPNSVCVQCHLPARFASDEHAGPGSDNCVDCHMPATTYMGVDDRRDHSFRLPDTATDPDHYGTTIAAGRAGEANAALIRGIRNNDFPAIARATLLTLLQAPLSDAEADSLLQQIDDEDPLVRLAALRALRQQPPALRLRTGSQLLRDPVRAVRIEAVLTYADFSDLLPAADTRALAAAQKEYRDALLANSSDAVSAVNLAELATRSGQLADARRWYEHALRIAPDNAAAQHAFGLVLVREGSAENALPYLRRASELAPDLPRFSYVYGIALSSTGQLDVAITTLAAARERFPDDFDIAWGLATLLRDAGRREQATALLTEMTSQFPSEPGVGQLLDVLSNPPN